MFIINGVEVLREFIVQTRTRQQVTREHYGYVHKVGTTESDGVITFGWQEFDEALQDYKASEHAESFVVQVGDDEPVAIAVGASLDLSGRESGIYVVRTINDAVGNAELTVNISAE